MRTPLQKDTHSVRDTMQSTSAQRASSAFARISTRASMRRQVRVSSSSFNRVLLLLRARISRWWWCPLFFCNRHHLSGRVVSRVGKGMVGVVDDVGTTTISWHDTRTRTVVSSSREKERPQEESPLSAIVFASLLCRRDLSRDD